MRRKKIEKKKTMDFRTVASILVVVSLAVFSFASFTFAGGDGNGTFWERIELKVIDRLVDVLAGKVGDPSDISLGEEDVVLGAGVPNRLPHGYWDTMYGYYVNGTEVISSDRGLTIAATTTLPVNVYTPIRQALSVSASSTLNDNEGQSFDDIASYTNTGVDLICTRVWVDPVVALGELTGSINVGTTTLSVGGSWTTTSTETLIASSTLAATDTFLNVLSSARLDSQSGTGTFFPRGDQGIATSTLFVLRNGETLLAAMNTFNATSSEDFKTTGGYTFSGYLNATCWTR